MNAIEINKNEKKIEKKRRNGVGSKISYIRTSNLNLLHEILMVNFQFSRFPIHRKIITTQFLIWK